MSFGYEDGKRSGERASRVGREVSERVRKAMVEDGKRDQLRRCYRALGYGSVSRIFGGSRT